MSTNCKAVSDDRPGYCPPHMGCGGRGWRWDSTDSGSGATVYCDCERGQDLRRSEEAAHRAPLHRKENP